MLREAGVLTEGNLYDIFNVSVVHHVQQSLRAHTLFARDVDYIVRDDQVIIIDEFTGRMMQGRRYSEGLHQALEAKEHVTVQAENQTLASITFQNYFRLYPKLAGMTGTAMTEADEFAEIYKLDVVEIPTNVPVIRNDEDDEVYRTADEKYEAVATLIDEARAKRPAGAGRHHLDREKRDDQRPAEEEKGAARGAERALPRAGSRDRVAGRRAGRGDDRHQHGRPRHRHQTRRQPGDAAAQGTGRHPRRRRPRGHVRHKVREEIAAAHEKVKEAGGLFVIGTERHESRRIDNQLRGRSGRQGDPGRSRFFLSLEDDLMRIFGSDRMGGMLQRLGLKEGEAIVHPWINKALEKAQKKVEARNFDTRKNVLKYDDVMNAQRKEVYAQRKEFMKPTDVSETVAEMRTEVAGRDGRAPGCRRRRSAEQWQLAELAADVQRVLNLDLPVEEWGKEDGIDETHLRERIEKAVDEMMAAKAANMGPDLMRFIEKSAADPDARRGVEGASVCARPSAPGHRPARLRPARSAERIQVRGLRPVQRHAGRVEGTRHEHAGAGGTGAGAADGAAAADARWWRATRTPDPRCRRIWLWPNRPLRRGSSRRRRTARRPSIRTMRAPGLRHHAMRRAHAGPARNTSIATAGLPERCLSEVSGCPILILGAPRSGTTWLAKIIDSHPDVLYRHEPDAADALSRRR